MPPKAADHGLDMVEIPTVGQPRYLKSYVDAAFDARPEYAVAAGEGKDTFGHGSRHMFQSVGIWSRIPTFCNRTFRFSQPELRQRK